MLDWQEAPGSSLCNPEGEPDCKIDGNTNYWVLAFWDNGFIREIKRDCDPRDSGCLEGKPFYDAAWAIGSVEPGDWVFTRTGAGCSGYNVDPPTTTNCYDRILTDSAFYALWHSGKIVCNPGSYDAGTCYVGLPPLVEPSINYPPCPGSPGFNLKFEKYARVRAACAAEPVNTAAGDYSTSLIDAKLPAPGLPFAFTRSYDSGDPSAGDLGPGWTDSYSASIQIQPNGDAIARSGGGQQVLFTTNGDGTFKSPADALVTLKQTSGGYELDYPDQSALSFDQNGRLLSIADANGNTISIGYDSNGLRSQITDSVGRVIRLTHDDAGLLTKLELPDGRSVSYAYTSGLLTSVTNSRGDTTTYTYDAQGELASIVDANGHTEVTNSYDDQGRVASQTDALGHTTTFSYGDDYSTSITDARGHTWRYAYDQNGNLASETNPDGETTSYANDDAGNTTSVTDALGNVLNIGYDGSSNPTSFSLPGGATSSAAYNALGDPTSLTDGLGNTSTVAYDAQGNPTLVTRADGSKASYSYNSQGLPVSYTNPSGATTSFSYDALGNLTASTSPLGEISSYGYNAAGNVTSFVDPRGNVPGANPADYRWHETYDDAGDLTSLTDPLGDTTSFSYDAVGNLVSRTDADGHTTSYAYDAANRLVTVTEPDGSTINYVYDEVGNLIARTDGLTQTTTYAYDAENRPVVVTSPTGKIWTLGYDVDGNLALVQTPSGGTIGYLHDSLGRVTQVSYSDGTPSVSYSYDADGNRVSMTDGSGTVRYAYDKLNRLISVDASAHRQRGAADSSASYAYDASGNVTSRGIAGTKVSYSYNADGNLASVKTTKPGKKATVLETDYSYDAAGNLIGTTLPNGVVEARTYDRAGRLTSIHATNPNGVDVFGVDYTLDPAGNPTQADFDKPSGAERLESYSYDSLGRLTGYCVTAGCKGENKIAYSYDQAGDRLTETIGKQVSRYAYDALGELLSQTLPDGTKIPYSYDQNGNETGAGPWSYAYNLANELVSASNGSTTAAYSYDGDGNRLTGQVTGSNSSSTSYIWDQNFSLPELAGTQDSSGTTLASYIYGVGPLAMIDATGAYRYYTTDQLGSIRADTGPAGGVRDRGSYMPFGETLANGGGAITNDGNPLAFAGQYLDPTTGLYDMRARNYDPSVGRFTSIDPLGYKDAPEASEYGYGRNGPTSFVDPSGMGAIGNTCGSVWCWLKSPEGRNSISCGLLAGAGVAFTGGAVVEVIEVRNALAIGKLTAEAAVSGSRLGTVSGVMTIGSLQLGGCGL